MVTHYFTVDVEEYYQVSALEPYVGRDSWHAYDSRVDQNVERLLDLMGDVRGTFFVLGIVAEQHPALVRKIAAAGHEIASHGWDHRRITQLTPGEFRSSIARSKTLLEDTAASEVLGFRAPSFSLIRGCEWAIEILIQEGYHYDSSLFPVKRNGYGYPGGRRDPHWLEAAGDDTGGRRLRELPPATLRVCGINLPAGGGAYFRLFPYSLVRAALKSSEARGASATFYLHPWELDPGQPQLDVPWTTRIRHYGGLRRTADRLTRLLSEFRFGPIADGLLSL